MNNRILKSGIWILVWLLLWQILSMIINQRLMLGIPSPTSSAQALFGLSRDARFWQALCWSSIRIGIGWAAAFVLGTAAALTSTRFKWFGQGLSPLIHVLRVIPVASLSIIVFLFASRENIPSIITFVTVLPIVYTIIYEGLLASNQALYEMSQVFGLSGRSILFNITLPSLAPSLKASIANGYSFAWKSGIAAEVICQSRGSIGSLIWSYKNYLEYDKIFAVTIAVILVASAVEKLLKKLLTTKEAQNV